MSRQYVRVKFRPSDPATFSYHNDDKPVKVGDEIEVTNHRSGKPRRVTVHSIVDGPPEFVTTKPILGLAPKRKDAPG